MILATVEEASHTDDTCACRKHNPEMSETGGCASRWEDRQGKAGAQSDPRFDFPKGQNRGRSMVEVAMPRSQLSRVPVPSAQDDVIVTKACR
jgi:hypothetical protein